MKLLISLSAASLRDVLTKMKHTIHSTADWRKMDSGIYTPNSCYGAVAHYLKTNKPDGLTVMAFGLGQWLSHVLLVDEHGNYKVNTEPGEIRILDGRIVFQQRDGKIHELIYSRRAVDFLTKEI